MKYNYLKNMKEDIIIYINDNYDCTEYTKEDLQTRLYDELWIEDSVTGNGSGSYTFNSSIAQEYVIYNIDLLREAFEEFGYSDIPVEKLNDFEYQDVTIRCYLLPQAIEEALKELYY